MHGSTHTCTHTSHTPLKLPYCPYTHQEVFLDLKALLNLLLVTLKLAGPAEQDARPPTTVIVAPPTCSESPLDVAPPPLGQLPALGPAGHMVLPRLVAEPGQSPEQLCKGRVGYNTEYSIHTFTYKYIIEGMLC